MPARAPGGAPGGASGACSRRCFRRCFRRVVPEGASGGATSGASGGATGWFGRRTLYLGMAARLHIRELLRGTLPGVPKVALGAIQARCRILMVALTIAERGHGARVSGRKAGLLFGGAALA